MWRTQRKGEPEVIHHPLPPQPVSPLQPTPCHFHSSSSCQRMSSKALNLYRSVQSTGQEKKKTGQYLISAEVPETVQTYRDNSVKLLPVLELRGSWLVVTSLIPFVLVSNVLPNWCKLTREISHAIWTEEAQKSAHWADEKQMTKSVYYQWALLSDCNAVHSPRVVTVPQ